MFHSILSAAYRGVIAFVLLMVVTRIMGRKTISQMTFFDFGVAITLGTLAASIGMGADINSTTATTVMIAFAAMGMLSDYLHIKSFFIRKMVDSEPVVLIQNGEIIKDNMEKSRVTINLLNGMLRQKNVFNIADVEFAILEFDGELSVLPKSQKQPITPSDLNIPTSYIGLTKEIIIDGNIMFENLRDAHLDERWLKDELRKHDIHDVKEVFFAALDTSGKLYVSKRIESRERHGQHGID